MREEKEKEKPVIDLEKKKRAPVSDVAGQFSINVIGTR